MQVVAHEDDSAEVKADLQFKGYVEYGQRFESLLADLGYPYKDPSA
jgi:hypothetical protein